MDNSLIKRQAAIDAADRADYYGLAVEDVKKVTDEVVKEIKKLPSAQPERKKGKWIEKEVIHKEEADEVIEEWQSCRCSECGRYDTRPYLYYFDEPRFCSWCGADMRGEETDRDCERAVEQLEHDILYEPTFNSDDGSM